MALYESMRDVLTESIEMGSLTYERGFYGRPGSFGRERYRAAYRAGASVPGMRRGDREDQDGVDGGLHLSQMPAARIATLCKRAYVKTHQIDLQVH